MLILTNPGTADIVQLVSSSTSALDVYAAHIDATVASPPVVDQPARTSTLISTAATTTIVAGPASGRIRNVKTINVRNRGAAANDVTITHVISGGNTTELHKATLQPGDTLEYVEGVGWFTVTSAARLDARLRVTTDVTNSTTSFADVTGLTCPVASGKHYNFEAHLYHFTAVGTTGANFAVNGPTVTSMRLQILAPNTGSLTAAAMTSNVSDVTARDTAAAAETTGPATTPVLAILSGWMNPSAAGTFAVRCSSEIAASALTVKAGSWCRIWEADN